MTDFILRKQEITPTPYTETAYKGKADSYYRNNIAPPEQRKRHLAKGQCIQRIFPREPITGICWDGLQENYNDANTQRVYKNINAQLKIKKEDLKLAMHTTSPNLKDSLFTIWSVLHIGCVITTLLFSIVLLIFEGVQGLSEFKIFFVYMILGILVSKLGHYLAEKLDLYPKSLYVIFDRKAGMVEITEERTGQLVSLPFEQFNAHHRSIHSERGAPYHGFTLLHYKEDLMHQVVDHLRLEGALIDWELIKNFMDTSRPLADIPQFEEFRLYDPTTTEFDKEHGRPENFWCRVDKRFIKKVSKHAREVAFKFPSRNANTLKEARKLGYEVPQILLFPWKEKVKLSETPLTFKSNWFVRFILNPLLP